MVYKIKKNTKLFINIFLINLIFVNFKIILFFNNLFSFIEYKKEFTNIEIFLNLTKKKKDKKIFKKINAPKISIISPLFNNDRYILRFLNNIQFQNFINLEIILIDDCSKDNSIKIIEEYKKYDKRIILIKNKKNRGTFISRNLGVLYSNGKYIIIPDPDDILSKNILNICYKYAEKYNFEIIRFNRYRGNNEIVFNDIENKIVGQPELSTYIFYEYKELDRIDSWITNKLIKKETYIGALNTLNNYYLNLYIKFSEDVMMNYILYRSSKSLYCIKKIGYYHIKNSISLTKTLFMYSELKIKSFFIVIKLVFDYSKNTKKEKDMSQFLFTQINKNFNNAHKLSIINYSYFYNDLINNLIYCKFFSKENKLILENYKNIIDFKHNNKILLKKK
jgi:glycosyltransferase involved in cell wall biosynthesis